MGLSAASNIFSAFSVGATYELGIDIQLDAQSN
jgi:hypothetical protein